MYTAQYIPVTIIDTNISMLFLIIPIGLKVTDDIKSPMNLNTSPTKLMKVIV